MGELYIAPYLSIGYFTSVYTKCLVCLLHLFAFCLLLAAFVSLVWCTYQRWIRSGSTQEHVHGGGLHAHARSSSWAHQLLRSVWVAMACPVMWVGVLELRDTLDAVLCAVRAWGFGF
jgi:hypothetical protein